MDLAPLDMDDPTFLATDLIVLKPVLTARRPVLTTYWPTFLAALMPADVGDAQRCYFNI